MPYAPTKMEATGIQYSTILEYVSHPRKLSLPHNFERQIYTSNRSSKVIISNLNHKILVAGSEVLTAVITKSTVPVL
jgi:hypothetical protein